MRQWAQPGRSSVVGSVVLYVAASSPANQTIVPSAPRPPWGEKKRLQGFSAEGEKSGGEKDRGWVGRGSKKEPYSSPGNLNSITHDVAVGTAERSKTGQRAHHRAVCEGKKFSTLTNSHLV